MTAWFGYAVGAGRTLAVILLVLALVASLLGGVLYANDGPR